MDKDFRVSGRENILMDMANVEDLSCVVLNTYQINITKVVLKTSSGEGTKSYQGKCLNSCSCKSTTILLKKQNV